MDPTQELQEEIIVALRASPAVAALVGSRVYDAAPASAVAPFISMGPATAVRADVECIPAQDVSLQIDCWSEERGFAQVRRVADAVLRALRDVDLPFQHNAIATFEHEITRYLRDPDGISNHAAMTFSATIEVR